jgi:hypothetical protein
MSTTAKKPVKSWVPAISVAIVGASIGFVVYYSVPALNSVFSGGCADGWAGFGCAILGALASLLVSAVVGGVIGFILFRSIKMQNAAWLAAGGTVLSGSLIFGIYKNLGQGFTAAVMWAGITLVCYLAVYFGFYVTKERKGLVTASVVVVAIVFYMFGGKLASSINTAAFNNQQAGTVQAAGFAVYLPQNIPAGYVFNGGMLTGQPGMPGNGPEMYGGEYYQPQNTFTQFSVTSLQAPPTYNPPSNCGPAQPNNSWQAKTPCQKIGVSAQGDPIYLATTKTINGDATFAAYVRIGQTLVTLTQSSGTELSNADTLKAFESLKAYSGHSLSALLTSGKE